MSSILVFCRDCGRQVPSSETEDQLCLDCRVRRSMTDLRDEHARLWRKRERYRSHHGANVAQISRQIVADQHLATPPKTAPATEAKPAYTGPTVGVSRTVRQAPTVGYRWAID